MAVAGRVDDDDVLRRPAAQAEVAGREVVVAPVVAVVVRATEVAVLLEDVEQQRRLVEAEALGGGHRQLEARGAQVVEQDVQVVGVDEAVLGRRVEQVLGMGRQELVDRCRRADERRQARPAATAGATHLLPGRGDRARVADADRGVEGADVDAELERIRGDHAAHATVPQAGLDRVPLVRQVAAAIAADRVRMARRGSERLAQVAGEHLDRGPRPGEGDRLDATADEPLRQPLRRQERGAADPELLVGDRRVDDEDVPAAGWRAVVVDQLDRRLEHALRQLGGVGDRGAGADEDRVGAVVGADAPQAPDDVRHVAAEQAAVRVQLVDDDVLQVLEELEPLRVVGKDRRVEHVGVGDDDLAGGAHDAPDVGRRVAVVGVRLQRRCRRHRRARAAPRADPRRGPWSGTGRARGPRGPWRPRR